MCFCDNLQVETRIDEIGVGESSCILFVTYIDVKELKKKCLNIKKIKYALNKSKIIKHGNQKMF